MNFGGGAVMSAGLHDGFIAKYASADGSYLVAKRLGNASDDVLRAVADGPLCQRA